MTDTEKFYEKIEAQEKFESFTDLSRYSEPPSDWFLIISDVMNSTKAIESGRYRDVNLVGASTIIATLNATTGKEEIPFVFGGDGATLMIPPSFLDDACKALLCVREMSQRVFELQLRIGVVSVSDVLNAGHSLKVSKLKLSNLVSQAMFQGDGFAWAEQQIKNPETQSQYLLKEPAEKVQESSTQYEGLECRWQNVRSAPGEVHSWLILATESHSGADLTTYNEVMKLLKLCYGSNEAEQHPVDKKNLHLTLSPFRLLKEVRIRFPTAKGLELFKHWAYAYLGTQLSRFFFMFKTRTFGVNWSEYQEDVPRNTDYRKFDGTLRMTISGTPEQRRSFERELLVLSGQRRLVYGLHVSDSALMTCMVFDRAGRHMHFVDGSDGGYAMAAKDLKAKRKSLL